jgi:hypothetical protein
MDVNLKYLRLLILSADRFSQVFTTELFKYYDSDNQVIFDNKTELKVLTTNVRRLSVLIIAMTEFLEGSGDSDEVINDIHDTAVINLNFSEQFLSILTSAKQ